MPQGVEHHALLFERERVIKSNSCCCDAEGVEHDLDLEDITGTIKGLLP